MRTAVTRSDWRVARVARVAVAARSENSPYLAAIPRSESAGY